MQKRGVLWICCLVMALTSMGIVWGAACTTTPSAACTVSSSLMLQPGSYNLNGSVQFITINTSNVVLDCNGSLLQGNSSANSFGIFLNNGAAENIVIKNCNITGYGWLIGSDTAIHTNVTLQNNRLYGGTVGIELSLNASAIFGNVVYNNSFGILLSESINSINSLIYNNSFSSYTGNAIQLLNATNISVYNNTVYASTKTGNASRGIYIGSSSMQNRIYNNLIYDGAIGIQLESASNNDIYGNTIRDFYCVLGSTCPADVGSLLVAIIPSSGNRIYNNFITNITTDSFGGGSMGIGITALTASDINITNNTITRLEVAFGVGSDGASNILIANNTAENGSSTSSFVIMALSGDLTEDFDNSSILDNTFRNWGTFYQCDDVTCSGNRFYQNNLINISLNAVTSDDGSYFNTSSRGNYWSDISDHSLNMSDTNTDGIYDAGSQFPYRANKGANMTSSTAVDNFPYKKQNGWNNLNPALLTNIPNQSFNRTQNVSINLSTYLSDADGDSLTFTVLGVNASLVTTTLNSTIGLLTFNGSFPGATSAVLNATDGYGGYVGSNNFTLTVTNRNPTLLTNIPNMSFAKGSNTTLNMTTYFSDADGDTINYAELSLNTTLVNATYNSTTTIYFFTSNATGGTVQHIILNASDSYGGYAESNNFSIIITCQENWTYSAWSTCSGSTQTRTAIDTNSCGTTENRSALSQSCTSASTGSGGSGYAGKAAGNSVSQSVSFTDMDVGENKATFSFKDIPLRSLVFIVTQEAKNVKITSSASTKAPQGVTVLPVAYKYITITHGKLAEEAITQVALVFTVDKVWVETNGFWKEEIGLSRFADGQWTALPTTFVAEDGTSYRYEATSPGLSVFAITKHVPPLVEPQQEEPILKQVVSEEVELPAFPQEIILEEPVAEAQPSALPTASRAWLAIPAVVLLLCAGIFVAYVRKRTR
ncbi:right-handed parallel beta-helix repeat-containing protein [Candidatus Woesearchaeota archaeon]|nr:right-handed parallel beta-helix repeat-containing protein [Candidatus Woesearchaeota archaeon]